MKILYTFGRMISSAWKHVFRNIWLSLTTVFVLMLALLSVNVVVGVSALLDQATHVLEEKIDISVYFKHDTPAAIVDQARFYLLAFPKIRSATVLTADQALEEFKTRHANDPNILDALKELEENPLGPTLIVKAKQAEDYPVLLEALKNPQFDFAIESKTYEDHADTINRVRDLGRSVRWFGFVLIGIFGIFSILIVYNTIRIAIYTHREEIGVMRLVGASLAFIRFPFILEGWFLGLMAMAFSAALVWAVASFLDVQLMSFFDGQSPGLQTYFATHALQMLGGEALILGVLIALSSWAAVGKYVKH